MPWTGQACIESVGGREVTPCLYGLVNRSHPYFRDSIEAIWAWMCLTGNSIATDEWPVGGNKEDKVCVWLYITTDQFPDHNPVQHQNENPCNHRDPTAYAAWRAWIPNDRPPSPISPSAFGRNEPPGAITVGHEPREDAPCRWGGALTHGPLAGHSLQPYRREYLFTPQNTPAPGTPGGTPGTPGTAPGTPVPPAAITPPITAPAFTVADLLKPPAVYIVAAAAALLVLRR